MGALLRWYSWGREEALAGESGWQLLSVAIAGLTAVGFCIRFRNSVIVSDTEGGWGALRQTETDRHRYETI